MTRAAVVCFPLKLYLNKVHFIAQRRWDATLPKSASALRDYARDTSRTKRLYDFRRKGPIIGWDFIRDRTPIELTRMIFTRETARVYHAWLQTRSFFIYACEMSFIDRKRVLCPHITMSLIAIYLSRIRVRVHVRAPSRRVLCSTVDKVYNVITDRKAGLGDVSRVLAFR